MKIFLVWMFFISGVFAQKNSWFGHKHYIQLNLQFIPAATGNMDPESGSSFNDELLLAPIRTTKGNPYQFQLNYSIQLGGWQLGVIGSFRKGNYRFFPDVFYNDSFEDEDYLSYYSRMHKDIVQIHNYYSSYSFRTITTGVNAKYFKGGLNEGFYVQMGVNLNASKIENEQIEWLEKYGREEYNMVAISHLNEWGWTASLRTGLGYKKHVTKHMFLDIGFANNWALPTSRESGKQFFILGTLLHKKDLNAIGSYPRPHGKTLKRDIGALPLLDNILEFSIGLGFSL